MEIILQTPYYIYANNCVNSCIYNLTTLLGVLTKRKQPQGGTVREK